ncbi:MAG: hypothetical protein IPM71_15690 [Bacteroidota bacterium]|nr:MAG: hypothetical protein IPM71_15495 [Bacteroidota bacterium]QQS50995.1 MAG: hypothetical protein IPM71_15690 [Bacteroidota bacterium]
MWKGTDEQGEVGYLSFDSVGYAMIIIQNDTLGGKKQTGSENKQVLTYQIDTNVTPITIDFIASLSDTKEELGRLLGIIEFINEKKMKIRLNFDTSERPKDFLPVGNIDTMLMEKYE